MGGFVFPEHAHRHDKMITHCRACGTSFRVTQSQIDARAGQVRCGHCGVIFDARATLTPDIPIPTPSEAESVPSAQSKTGKFDAQKVPLAMAVSWDTTPLSEKPSRKKSSRLWSVAAIFISLVLVLQIGFRFRGELAHRFPDAKPVIQSICAELNCDIPLPQQAELISIETSDLRADGANLSVMVLSATLRNRATFVQSLPALELTLTDAQNKTLARRVLTPRDYGLSGARLESGFTANSELPIRIFIDTGTLKPVGYRLYLFYS